MEEPQQQDLLPTEKPRAVPQKNKSSSHYCEEAVEILKTAGMKGMHVDDIVKEIVNRTTVLKDTPDRIKTIINACLSNKAGKVDKPKVGSEIRRVNNQKTGRPKQGWYRYQKPRAQPTKPIPPMPPEPVGTRHFGTGGEYAVASEFLFNGYNVSIPSVDSGIDLIVFKSGHFSNIQVKTASETNGKYQFTIKSKVFANNSGIDTFYALVCRRWIKNVYRNDFIILPSTAIEFFVNTNVVSMSDTTISFNISFDSDNNVIINGKQQITMYLNRF